MFTVTSVLWVAVTLMGSYIVGSFLFRKDTEVENRRRAASKVAQAYTGFGLTRVPAILTDYSVGDYSGMAHKIKSLAELLTSDPLIAFKELEAVFERALTAKLSTPEGKAYIAAKLVEVSKATPTA